MKRVAAPRIKQTSPGSRYRYKLVYPNGYVKYVQWPEQLPKDVSNPQDKKQMIERASQKKMEQVASELLRLARDLTR